MPRKIGRDDLFNGMSRRIDHDLFACSEAFENFLQIVGRMSDLNGSTFQPVLSLDVADVSAVLELHGPGRHSEHVLAMTAQDSYLGRHVRPKLLRHVSELDPAHEIGDPVG